VNEISGVGKVVCVTQWSWLDGWWCETYSNYHSACSI